jgi:hypothetical protein
MQLKKWVLMGLLAQAFLLWATVAQASHSWGGYHWARTSNPFSLTLVDSVSSSWDSSLSTAASDWSAASVLNTTIAAGDSSASTRANCPAIRGQIRVCNYTYGSTGWRGLAQIWISGSHITRGITKLNDSYSMGTATRHLVMCQEIGHTFGLAHQDETRSNANLGSCMDYTNDPEGGAGGGSSTDPSNEHPNQHDYNQLATIYSHLDSTTTIGAALPAATPAEGEGGSGGGPAGPGGTTVGARATVSRGGSGDFGRPTGVKDAQGRDILFVQEVGPEEKLYTWVLWAEAP